MNGRFQKFVWGNPPISPQMAFPKYSSTALSRVLRPQLAKARTPAVHLNSSVR